MGLGTQDPPIGFHVRASLRSSKDLSLFLLCLEKQTDYIKDVTKVSFNSPRPLLIIHISINNVKKIQKEIDDYINAGRMWRLLCCGPC